MLKLIAPFRPRLPMLGWEETAAAGSSAGVTPNPAVLAILDHHTESGKLKLTAAHRDLANLLEATSSASDEGILRVLIEQATINDPAEEAQSENLLRYGRIERVGTALCAWQPGMLEELIRATVALHDHDETRSATVGNRSGRTAAVLADILAGSLTLVGDAERRQLIRSITASVSLARGAKKGTGARADFWDRLQSWPSISSLL